VHNPGRSLGQVLGLVAAALALAGLGGSAQAMPISYIATAEINYTMDVSGEIEVGDRFDFAFTYDDSVVDVESWPLQGRFPWAQTAFVLTRHPSNAGTWDPATGTFDMPQFVETEDVPGQDGLLLYAPPNPGFPTLGGEELSTVQLDISTSLLNFVNDTGTGQTLAEVLGGPLPEGDSAIYDGSGNNWFAISSVGTPEAEGWVIAVHRANQSGDIPEPTTLSLLALGGLGLLRRRRRKGA
jgi:hypothetical protein